MKVVLLSALALSAGLLLCWYARGTPNEQNQIVDNFKRNKTAFEHIRDMMRSDENISRLGPWGIQTTKSLMVSIPPDQNLSRERFDQYLALLKKVGGQAASYSRAEGDAFCVGISSEGWAGDAAHTSICWLEKEPKNQVDDLSSVIATATNSENKRKFGYKKIEDNWYIQKDF